MYNYYCFHYQLAFFKPKNKPDAPKTLICIRDTLKNLYIPRDISDIISALEHNFVKETNKIIKFINECYHSNYKMKIDILRILLYIQEDREFEATLANANILFTDQNDNYILFINKERDYTVKINVTVAAENLYFSKKILNFDVTIPVNNRIKSARTAIINE